MTSRQIRPKTLITIAATIIILLVGALWYRKWTTVPAGQAPVIQETVDRGLQPEDRARLQEEIDTLAAAIETAEAEGNRDISKHLELGVKYYGIGELGKANDEFQNILDTNPQDTPAMEAMGQTYVEMGEYQKAADIWIKSLNVVANELIYLKLVDLYNEHLPEKKPEIKIVLETAIGNLGQTPSLLQYLGQWYVAEEMYTEAISHFEVAIRLDPQNAFIAEQLAEARAALAKSQGFTDKPRSR